MPNYIRYHIPGGCNFFTVNHRNRREGGNEVTMGDNVAVNLAERRRTLLVDHADALRNMIRTIRQRHPFRIEVMGCSPITCMPFSPCHPVT